MKKCIPALCLVLLVGCSQQPTAETEPASESKLAGLTQDQVAKLATDFKTEWLKQNSRDPSEAFDNFVSAKQTPTGWHVIFGSARISQPEGIQYGRLHIYIDSKGKLEKIVREPDEVA